MLKAIFFDMEGVLVEAGFKKAVAEYEKEFQIPAGEFYKIVHDHQGWKDLTLGNISEEDYFRLCIERKGSYIFDTERYLELLEKFIAPKKEVIDYAKELSNKYVIGIVSNNPKEWFERLIKRTGLAEIVKVMAISSYFHIRKPDPALFQKALDLAGVKGEEAIYIDDRPDRIEGAEELGVRVVIFDGKIDHLRKQIEIS